MLRSRCTQLVVMAAVAPSLLLVSGCIVVKDSLAPGCIEYIGFPAMGGCFGKTAILDLTVEPEVECLDITANNCNGGILEVRNGCSEPLALGGVEIAPLDYVGLDVAEEGGEYLLIEVNSNFSEYAPEADEMIEVGGTLGGQEIRLTFTKTAPLCQ